MYPENMTKLYSNGTCRKSRNPDINSVVVFGIQHFVKTYLIEAFNKEFFLKDWKDIKTDYEKHCPVNTDHIQKLHELGYLPIALKALPEGSLCPIGVPMLTITNTHPGFGWLVNYLETLISCSLWQCYTSATIAYEYKKLLTKYALETTGTDEGVQWQGHDFSMRGMSSVESSILSGMGHLLSFTGTDTIPAIYTLESSYNATGLIGASVPATEHSVMCMGTKETEIKTFERLLDLYPTGILSVVSDTWDLWKVCTEYLPALKDKILARDGKLVIRPDSGDPVDIICGTGETITLSSPNKNDGKDYEIKSSIGKGVIELLWEIFGGKINKHGYKELDPHIGAIYGDSITLERAKAICERLKAKGFASTNIVFGIGSYTYQYNTRDTFGFAMKATYGEVWTKPCNKETGCLECKAVGQDTDICKDGCVQAVRECREIFKQPITDDGTKKSAKGLLQVYETSTGYKLKQQCTWEEEHQGALQTVFINGQLIRETDLETIRKKLNNTK